ncbi:hypothetical protein AtEden1_Chr4g0297211 [Arabidopsis thaliana]
MKRRRRVKKVVRDYRRIWVFWDYENAQLPRGFNRTYVVRMFRNFMRSRGYFGQISILMVVSEVIPSKISYQTYEALYAQSLIDNHLIVENLDDSKEQASDEFLYDKMRHLEMDNDVSSNVLEFTKK